MSTSDANIKAKWWFLAHILYFGKMTYAIGDIHGCATALQALLNAHTFKSNDRIVLLGDYVNKGPDSKGVIDLLISFSQKHECVFLKGNHEIMMLTARESALHFDQWMMFGGKQTLQSYGISPSDPDWITTIPDTHWQFLEKTEAFFSEGDVVFVHGGLEPGISLEEQNAHHLYWKKYENPDQYADNLTVICGHTSRKNGEIADFGHTICIDTFACGGQWLTMLNVHDYSFTQTNEHGQSRSGQLRKIVR